MYHSRKILPTSEPIPSSLFLSLPPPLPPPPILPALAAWFSGGIPLELGSLEALEELDLSNNFLDGEL